MSVSGFAAKRIRLPPKATLIVCYHSSSDLHEELCRRLGRKVSSDETPILGAREELCSRLGRKVSSESTPILGASVSRTNYLCI